MLFSPIRGRSLGADGGFLWILSNLEVIGRAVEVGEQRYYLLNPTVFLTIPQNSADKVIKIHKDKVEFERDGNRWTQRLNEPPGREWQ